MTERDGVIRIENHLVARKGAGKGGAPTSTPYQPVVYANTMRSMSTARIVEVLSEGIIKGPHGGGWESVYYNGTPVQNTATGSFNFTILEGYARYGAPFQDPIPGYSLSEAEFAVGVELNPFVPVTRRLSAAGISAVRFELRVQQLYMTETDGDVNGTSLTYAFDVSIDGAPWYTAVYETLWGKTMSPYVRAIRVQLPYSATSVDIQMQRLSDVENPGEVKTCFFSSYTEIQDGMISYDDTALWAVTIDAQSFPSLPSRAYLLDGIMLMIPSNYDGVSHITTGDWDGTFKLGWTNNPAWVLYGLLTNERWGLGRDIDTAAIDKWSFYEAALFNDDVILTPDGGAERRYTCNCVINTRQDAWTVLTAVASTMLATVYFGSGTVFLSQDRPGTVERAFGTADIENGIFEYVGTDYRSRWTAAAITWNDPGDSYNQAVELVPDTALMATQGYRETQQAAFACTSRFQAIRYGRWLIYTSQNETETVTFSVGLENADLRPGDLIGINDPSRAGARLAGRLLADDGPDTLTLDQTPPALASGPWTLFLTMGSADQAQTPTLVAVGLVAVLPDNQVRVSGKPAGAIAGTSWFASSPMINATSWRVNSISDLGRAKYQILATEYHAEKWEYVAYGINMPQPPFSLIPTGPLIGPTNVNDTEFIYLDAMGAPTFGIILSWTASTDARVANYQVELSGPNGDYRRFPLITGITQEVLAMRQGEWLAVITAFDNIGRKAAPVYYRFTPIGLLAKPLPPSSLYITPQGGNLSTLTWTPTGEIDVVYYWVKWTGNLTGASWDRATTSIARVDRNTTQVQTPTRAGTFMVKTIDGLGQESDDWAEAILQPQQTETSIFFDEHQQPTWAGTLGLWHHNIGEVWLPPPDAPEPVPPGVFPGERGLALNKTPTRIGVYDFDAGFDLGVSTLVTMTGYVEGYGTVLGMTMAKWVPLASAVPLAAGTHNSMSTWVPLAVAIPLAKGSTQEWDGHIEAAVSMDGVTYDAWFPLKSTVITGQAFKWRMVGTLYDLQTTMRAVRAGVIITVPLRNVQGSDVPLDGTGHLVVTYVAPFLVTPTVQLTARQSLQPGGNIVITESDRNHFKVENRDAAGAAHAGGSIDYFVQGYGGHS